MRVMRIVFTAAVLALVTQSAHHALAQDEKAPVTSAVDLGQKIGVLTAVRTYAADPVDAKPRHVFRCSCGRELVIKDEYVEERKHDDGESLRAGAIESCGEFWEDRVRR